MVPLNPSTPEAVYTTMSFVAQQCKTLGQHCAVLTFDQPLFLKAYTIRQDHSVEFKNTFIRLGGFHQLMSFLGAGCHLMEDSGLDELWTTVYAPNSLHKMKEGKAYTKALRACLLTDAALHVLLLSDNNNVDVEERTAQSGIYLDEEDGAFYEDLFEIACEEVVENPVSQSENDNLYEAIDFEKEFNVVIHHRHDSEVMIDIGCEETVQTEFLDQLHYSIEDFMDT